MPAANTPARKPAEKAAAAAAETLSETIAVAAEAALAVEMGEPPHTEESGGGPPQLEEASTPPPAAALAKALAKASSEASATELPLETGRSQAAGQQDERGAWHGGERRMGPLADAQSYGSGEICRLLQENGGMLCRVISPPPSPPPLSLPHSPFLPLPLNCGNPNRSESNMHPLFLAASPASYSPISPPFSFSSSLPPIPPPFSFSSSLPIPALSPHSLPLSPFPSSLPIPFLSPHSLPHPPIPPSASHSSPPSLPPLASPPPLSECAHFSPPSLPSLAPTTAGVRNAAASSFSRHDL
ncbi:unnamed protein product [Closterium sp. Naga37s-1]|nr:unnamed protein product [Closterium sp. Naga37s-1]